MKFTSILSMRFIMLATMLITTIALNAQTTVTINCTGTSGSYKSGFVTSAGAVTDGTMTVSNASGSTPKGWAVFNVASLNIPSNAVITGVSLRYTKPVGATGTGTPTCSVLAYAGDLSSNSGAGSTLYSNITGGTTVNTTAFGNNANTNTLTLNAAGVTFIQNNFSAVVSMGFAVTSSSRVFTITGYEGTTATQPQLSITYTAPCSGTPAIPTAASPSSVCPNKSFNISATGTATGTGITYQWQSSPSAANTWTDIASATTATYSISSGITTATDFRLITKCSGNDSSTSNVATTSINAATFCLCPSTSTSGSFEYISNISSGTFTNNSGRTNYATFTGLGAINTVNAGTSFDMSIKVTTAYATDVVYVYLDADHDGSLSASDIIGTTTFTGITGGTTTTKTITCNVPAGAIPGLCGLRVRVGDASDDFTNDPCQASYTYGEVEDYAINILAAPSCLPPSNVSVVPVGSNSVSVNFTPSLSNPVNGYDYYIKTVNVAPTSDSLPNGNGSSSPLSIGSLAPNTLYYVWIRSKCSGSDQSSWVNAGSAQTLCNPSSPRYEENFENAVTPAIPGCSHVENAGTGNNWQTSEAPDDYGFTTLGGNVLYYEYSSTDAANTWWYTNGINLTGGTNYYISYKYGNDASSSFFEKMKVAYGTAPDHTAMTIPLADYPNINDGVAHTDKIIFTPATTGTYYFGFNAYSDADMDLLMLDSIVVDEVQTCEVPTAWSINGITGNSANLNFTASTSAPALGYEYYISSANVPPTASTTPSGSGPTSPIIMDTLNSVTTYYVWMRSACSSADHSSWVTVGSFLTLPANDEANNATTLTLGAGCTGNPYNNTGATHSANEPYPSCKNTNGFAGVWFKFVAPASGAVKVSCDGTAETIGNTRMALYNVLDPSDYTSFTIIACDDDNGVATANKSLFYAAGLNAGQTYYVLVDVSGNGQARGSFCMSVNELTSAMIATNTADCAADQGSVTAYSSSYQGWISLVDASGNLIANVRQTSGTATAFSSSLTIKNGTARTDASGLSYLNRNFLISGNNATSADLQLFFTDAELSNLGASIGSLNVSRVAGSTCNANFAGTATALTQTANGSVNGVNFIQVSTPGFSNFYIMSGTTPLPLSLISFKGYNSGSENILTWETAAHSGIDYFELQHATDGADFEKITTIVKNEGKYMYADKSPYTGSNFYRLKMFDASNRYTFSEVIEINNTRENIMSVTVRPNPVQQTLQISLSQNPKGAATIEIFDMLGKIVKSVSLHSTTASVDMSSIASGNYIVRYKDDSNSYTIKISKQ